MLMLLSEAGAAERLAEEAAALERQAPDLGGARNWVADLRFRGQAYELRVPLSKPDPVEAAAALQEAHQRRFGFVPSGEPEVVNLRLVASGKARTLPPREVPNAAKAKERTVELFGQDGWKEVPWLDRSQLLPGARFTGPAVVTQYDCTTLVPVSWKGEVDAQGNLLLEPR